MANELTDTTLPQTHADAIVTARVAFDAIQDYAIALRRARQGVDPTGQDAQYERIRQREGALFDACAAYYAVDSRFHQVLSDLVGDTTQLANAG